MRRAKPSSSAQTVTLVRAHLTWVGVLDDPWAETMLRPRWRVMGQAMRCWPLTRSARSAAFSFLAARTLFFDDIVTRALDAGVHQVAVIGAGYDSRAWRLARPSVRFFEVDHPATQRDKRLRAPGGGPTYVAADLSRDSLAQVLRGAGFVRGARSVFVVEGLTMYLPECAVIAMLSTLAELAGPGSQLAVNFTARGGDSGSPMSRFVAKAMRTSWRLAGEPTHRWVREDEVPVLLTRTGWVQRESLPGPVLLKRYLAGTDLPTVGAHPAAFFVTADRV